MPAAEIVILVIGGILLALVIGTTLAAWIAQRRNPPVGRFVQTANVRLHYLEEGPTDARPVVLLHGNGALIQDWTASGLVRLARGKYRVLVFDRPGFGYSARPRSRAWTPEAQAEVLAAAFDRLGVRDPVVVGQSWGTLVALALARIGRAKGLVLVAGYYFPSPRKDVWLMSGPAIPILGDVIRYTVAPLLGWIMLPAVSRRLFAPRPVPEVFNREFPRGLALRPSQIRAAAEENALMVPAAARGAPTYRNLACPVAIVVGEGDQIVEPDQASRLQRELPRAVIRTLPQTGHMAHYAAPERILDAIDLVEAWPEVGNAPPGRQTA
jgi:pimeloyl-ACP methyl ester carboxylesterase